MWWVYDSYAAIALRRSPGSPFREGPFSGTSRSPSPSPSDPPLQHEDVPGAEIVTVVALADLARRGAVATEVRSRGRARIVLVVSRRGVCGSFVAGAVAAPNVARPDEGIGSGGRGNARYWCRPCLGGRPVSPLVTGGDAQRAGDNGQRRERPRTGWGLGEWHDSTACIRRARQGPAEGIWAYDVTRRPPSDPPPACRDCLTATRSPCYGLEQGRPWRPGAGAPRPSPADHRTGAARTRPRR